MVQFLLDEAEDESDKEGFPHRTLRQVCPLLAWWLLAGVTLGDGELSSNSGQTGGLEGWTLQLRTHYTVSLWLALPLITSLLSWCAMARPA